MELVVAIGSQPVAVWNVEDHVMAQRIDSAEHKHTEIDMDSPPTWAEKKAARTASMDAHENARKGAVTAVLKSALRGYGEQFGNSLYGDGTKTQQASRPATVEQLKHIKAFCDRLNREPPQGDISYADADKLLHELVQAYNTAPKTYLARGW